MNLPSGAAEFFSEPAGKNSETSAQAEYRPIKRGAGTNMCGLYNVPSSILTNRSKVTCCLPCLY
jgi:hypothetical protein